MAQYFENRKSHVDVHTCDISFVQTTSRCDCFESVLCTQAAESSESDLSGCADGDWGGDRPPSYSHGVISSQESSVYTIELNALKIKPTKHLNDVLRIFFVSIWPLYLKLLDRAPRTEAKQIWRFGPHRSLMLVLKCSLTRRMYTMTSTSSRVSVKTVPNERHPMAEWSAPKMKN